jgi:hypothetical protein
MLAIFNQGNIQLYIFSIIELELKSQNVFIVMIVFDLVMLKYLVEVLIFRIGKSPCDLIISMSHGTLPV